VPPVPLLFIRRGLTQDVWQTRTAYDPARHRGLQQHVLVTVPTPSGPVPDTAATQRMLGVAVTRRADRKVRAQRA
jgi:hypothetical protein